MGSISMADCRLYNFRKYSDCLYSRGSFYLYYYGRGTDERCLYKKRNGSVKLVENLGRFRNDDIRICSMGCFRNLLSGSIRRWSWRLLDVGNPVLPLCCSCNDLCGNRYRHKEIEES